MILETRPTEVSRIIAARYLIVGGTCAVIDLAFFAVLLEWSGLNWFASATISFVIATTANYFLSIFFVFTSGARFAKPQEVGLVFLVSALGLAMNQMALWLFFEGFDIDVYLAKMLSTAVVFFWNFGMRRYVIFRKTAV